MTNNSLLSIHSSYLSVHWGRPSGRPAASGSQSLRSCMRPIYTQLQQFRLEITYTDCAIYSALLTAMTTTDIPIKFVNATKQTDFSVIVFTKNDFPRVTDAHVAWQVLRTNVSVMFVYPASNSIGASFDMSNTTIILGPFPAGLGSTWEIIAETEKSTPVLKEVLHNVPANPNGEIVVRNARPPCWSGRKYDVSLYKSDSPLMIQRGVLPGDQAVLVLRPILYFGIVRNMKVGDVFPSLEIASSLMEFDITKYPNGLEVTLSQEPSGGMYVFTGTQMQV